MSHSDTYLIALLLALPCAASGGEADLISARAIRAANGSFNFDVTIWSQDHGRDHYADRFEVLAPDGMATRICVVQWADRKVGRRIGDRY
jgi:hypothetical protein